MKRRLLLIALGLVLLVGGAATFLLSTTTGLRWTLQWVAHSAGGVLRVEHLGGRLLGPIVVSGLRFDAKTLELRLAHGRIAWRPWALLSGVVHLTQVRIDGLDVERKSVATATPQNNAALPSIKLPIGLRIDQLDVDQIKFSAAPQRPPVEIQSVRLRAHSVGSRLQLSELQIVAPSWHVDVAGALTPQGDYPLALQVRWQAHVNGRSMTGRAQMSGSLKKLQVEQTTAGAARTGLKATVTDVSTKPHWQGHVTLEHIDPALLGPRWRQASVSASADIVGDVRSSRATISARLKAPELGILQLHGQGVVDDVGVRVSALRIDRVDSAAVLQAHGFWQWQSTPSRFDLAVNWSALAWPRAGPSRRVSSPSGRLQLSGNLSQYKYAVEADVAGPGLPPAHLGGRGTGSLQHVDISQLQVSALNGRVDGSAQLTWAPQLRWQANLTMRDIDPGRYWAAWKGKLQADVALHGERGKNGLGGTVELHRLGGQLRGYELGGNASLRWRGEQLEQVDLRLRSGDAHLRVNGAVTDRWQLDWNLRIPDLAAVAPSAAGSLNLSAAVRGARQAPTVKGSVTAKSIRIANAEVRSLSGNYDLGLAAGTPFDVDARALGVNLSAQHWQEIRLLSKGASDRHRIQLWLADGARRVEVALRGGLSGLRRWRGQLTTVNVRLPGSGAWSLEKPGSLDVAPAALQLGPWCLRQASARLCVSAQQAGAVWSAEVKLDRLPLAAMKPWLAAEATLEGSVSGSLQARYVAHRALTLQAKFTNTAGSLKYPLADAVQTLTFGAGTWEAQVDKQGADLRMQLPVDRDGTVAAQLRAPGWQPDRVLATQAIDGSLRAQLPSLGLLRPLFPGTAELAGRAALQLTLAGTAQAPVVRGSASVDSGSVDVPALGVGLREMSMSLQADGANLDYHGSIRSGKGQLKFSGQTVLNASSGWPSKLDVEGSDFQVADIPEANVVVSPKLHLQTRGKRIDLTGEVTVPRADIRPKKLPKGAVAVSNDVVVVDKQGKPVGRAKSPWEIHARVQLILGDKVMFDGLGLRGRLVGRLLLIDEPAQLTIGRGELSIVDGTYKAYGQNLIVDRGRLIFADSVVSDPGVDVRATRTVQSVVAGIQVSGTLKAPRLTLFSTPAMPDSQVLSYLITGHALGAASGGQSTQLAAAATALGLYGGESVAKSIGSALGLNEVSIENSGGTQGSELVLGRYLSPKLYLRYALGLFDKSEVLQLRYDLARHLQLQTETGTRSGVDLFYTIE